MSTARYLAATLLSLIAPSALAFDTDLSARAAIWSGSQSLDDQEDLTPIQLWVRSRAAWQEGDAEIKLYGEGWTEYQPRRAGMHNARRLREAYAQFGDGPFEIRAGWQIFAWGRTDGINPTDNLSPRQYTLLTRDTDDQRFGSPALRGTWFAGPASLNLIWLAGFKPSEFPWPAGLPVPEDLKPLNEARQGAARLDLVLDDIEGSLSYFDGYDVLPSEAVMASSRLPHAVLLHERLKIAGADMATTVGRFGLRAEMAHMEPADAAPGVIFAKQPQWYMVAGGDRTFGEYFNINLQYYYRYVDGTAVPQGLPAPAESLGQALAITAQQYDRIDRGFTFRISDQWLNETLETSVSGVFSTTRSGYLVRPLVKYQLADSWTIALGAEILGGSRKSVYGALHGNATTYCELRWGF